MPICHGDEPRTDGLSSCVGLPTQEQGRDPFFPFAVAPSQVNDNAHFRIQHILKFRLPTFYKT